MQTYSRKYVETAMRAIAAEHPDEVNASPHYTDPETGSPCVIGQFFVNEGLPRPDDGRGFGALNSKRVNALIPSPGLRRGVRTYAPLGDEVAHFNPDAVQFLDRVQSAADNDCADEEHTPWGQAVTEVLADMDSTPWRRS